MSILSFIKKVCVQDAIYWEYLGSDGVGGSEYEDPADIKVRWDDHTQIIAESNGKELRMDAQILSPIDLKEQSIVKLGLAADLTPGVEVADVEEAYEIKRMDRHPLFKSTTMDVFMAYLGRR